MPTEKPFNSEISRPVVIHPQAKTKPKVLVLGAGPAGLTAALELICRDYDVTVLEQDPTYVGGISRTVRYKDYRFDIGGHRFFSKNQKVVDWWYQMMGQDFLTRPRLSRWLYRGKFFAYPIKIAEILHKFGLGFAVQTAAGLAWRKFAPVKPEDNLEAWFRNHFGDFLAQPFFIRYNEKLWGLPCKLLSTDFAGQRIKGVSIWNTITSALRSGKKNQVKSFIDQFNYPRQGPGELWERAASKIQARGGQVLLDRKVVRLEHDGKKITQVIAQTSSGEESYAADWVLSTIPYRELAQQIYPSLEPQVLAAADWLKFRDFVTVALVIDTPYISEDTWVYTHDEGLRSIRFQNFRNWSPFMIPNEDQSVIGLEYTCTYGDEFWEMSDSELIEQGKADFLQLGFASEEEISDAAVVRMRNVYPVYQIGYEEKVQTLRNALERFNNLLPFGRGGIHRYNNSDHSMMTAFLTVENVLAGRRLYDVFKVNQDAEYHEEQKPL